MFGTTAGLGVKPAKDALLIVYCSPVGAYFKQGIKPILVAIDREQDRAAPRGTGDVKVGGNYAASLLSGEKGHKMGYSNIMYLDAAEHKYIEECGACNFFGIKDGKYITPKSSSVLPSITNMSLRQLARDMGLEVEDRKIPVEELASFEECGGCGTAAVISLSALSMTCRRRKPTLIVIRLVRFLWNYIPDCRIFSTDELRINIIGVRLFCRIRIYC